MKIRQNKYELERENEVMDEDRKDGKKRDDDDERQM